MFVHNIKNQNITWLKFVTLLLILFITLLESLIKICLHFWKSPKSPMYPIASSERAQFNAETIFPRPSCCGLYWTSKWSSSLQNLIRSVTQTAKRLNWDIAVSLKRIKSLPQLVYQVYMCSPIKFSSSLRSMKVNTQNIIYLYLQ